jgi:hypothetical protein
MNNPTEMGVQHAHLFFGPIEQKSISQWVKIFKIIDLENDDRYHKAFECGEEYELDSDTCCDFNNFIDDLGIELNYDNNIDWDECRLGYKVQDFEYRDSISIDKIKKMCIDFNLSIPTYYGGIVGEYE